VDSSRFDQLARDLGRGGSRRTWLKVLLGIGGLAVAGTARTSTAVAAAGNACADTGELSRQPALERECVRLSW
jgi:hypothetical protein